MRLTKNCLINKLPKCLFIFLPLWPPSLLSFPVCDVTPKYLHLSTGEPPGTTFAKLAEAAPFHNPNGIMFVTKVGIQLNGRDKIEVLGHSWHRKDLEELLKKLGDKEIKFREERDGGRIKSIAS
jgi:hypothetical protein